MCRAGAQLLHNSRSPQTRCHTAPPKLFNNIQYSRDRLPGVAAAAADNRPDVRTSARCNLIYLLTEWKNKSASNACVYIYIYRTRSRSPINYTALCTAKLKVLHARTHARERGNFAADLATSDSSDSFARPRARSPPPPSGSHLHTPTDTPRNERQNLRAIST